MSHESIESIVQRIGQARASAILGTDVTGRRSAAIEQRARSLLAALDLPV